MSRRLNAEEMFVLKQRSALLGGEMLSRALRGTSAKLRFRCAQGHVWEQSLRQLDKGKWCMVCAKARKNQGRKAASFARLQRVVEARGGTIVSSTYTHSREPILLRCAEGHEWHAVPKMTLRGSWCRACGGASSTPQAVARREAEFDVIRRFVEQQGGSILSPGTMMIAREVLVQCQRGHEWRTLPQHLLAEAWCQQCRKDQMLQNARELALSHGGECLSSRCSSRQDLLEWRCARGHRFEAREGAVRIGTWCAKCRWSVAGDIEQMRQIAGDRGGLCLSFTYKGSEAKLRWRCSEGHVWLAQPGSVRQGSWCPSCARQNQSTTRRLTIAHMRQVAMERWGACLSKKYLGSSTHLRWRCARGHTWDALPWQVRQGQWCPMCSWRYPGTLEGMAAVAEEHSGKLVTRTWTDHRVPIEFECDKAHRFALLAVAAKSGAWCPVCRACVAANRRSD